MGGEGDFDLFWTAEFSEFKKKVESVFGPLEIIAEEAPDIYAHEILSHGFMEYAGITGIYKKIKEKIAGSEEEFHKIFNGTNIKLVKEYKQKFDEELKKIYMDWAKKNNLPEHLLEKGWQKYLND